MSRQTSRFWCFTINNEKYQRSKLPTDVYDYCIMGNETGDNGTPHIQGFIVMKKRTEFSRMQRLLPRAHLEVMRSSPQQAANYCKKDGDYFEDGNIDDIDWRGGASGGKAKHARYTEVIRAAKSGDFDFIENKHPDMYWNNYHTMKRIAMDNPAPVKPLDELNNEWIWGEPGIGKSRMARSENPDMYIKSHNKWWLGYKGEDVVLIDDLGKTDSNWIGEYLKQWADHYPFPAETKGDGSVLRPKRIIVTSNYSIEDLWGHDDALCAAIKRRFKIRHLVDPWAPPAEAPKVDNDIILIDDESEDLGEL